MSFHRMSDAQAQAEELEVIEAIYPNYFNLMEVNKVFCNLLLVRYRLDLCCAMY